MTTPKDINGTTGEQARKQVSSTANLLLQLGQLLAVTLLPLVVFVGLAAAAPAGNGLGSDFCGTKMADTIRNVFTLIQYGGPLIGGVLALGATVVIPYVRRADVIQELKTMRNQAIVWGVLVAPLGTEIVGFLLNNVVSGGASCAF